MILFCFDFHVLTCMCVHVCKCVIFLSFCLLYYLKCDSSFMTCSLLHDNPWHTRSLPCLWYFDIYKSGLSSSEFLEEGHKRRILTNWVRGTSETKNSSISVRTCTSLLTTIGYNPIKFQGPRRSLWPRDPWTFNDILKVYLSQTFVTIFN